MQHQLSECCDAAKRVWERAALSYESQAAYCKVLAKQTWEQLEAVRARRSRPVLTEMATFELQLPDGWEQDPPSRLDMCSRCAKLLEQVDGFCMGGVRAGAARGGCGFGAMQLSAAARRASLLCASDTRCADEC